jgi:hypothetical protein
MHMLNDLRKPSYNHPHFYSYVFVMIDKKVLILHVLITIFLNFPEMHDDFTNVWS